jgi:hypothetical protein
MCEIAAVRPQNIDRKIDRIATGERPVTDLAPAHPHPSTAVQPLDKAPKMETTEVTPS